MRPRLRRVRRCRRSISFEGCASLFWPRTRKWIGRVERGRNGRRDLGAEFRLIASLSRSGQSFHTGLASATSTLCNAAAGSVGGSASGRMFGWGRRWRRAIGVAGRLLEVGRSTMSRRACRHTFSTSCRALESASADLRQRERRGSARHDDHPGRCRVSHPRAFPWGRAVPSGRHPLMATTRSRVK